MLEVLLGSSNKEKILLYILCRESGYAREMADFFNISLTAVLKQLKRLEDGNVLYAQMQGRTKVYRYNLRYPFLKELKLLLQKTLEFYPEDIVKKLKYSRKRPRRNDKPL
jgi:predicted transcriptional regulator